MKETQVQSLGQEDLLWKEMTTHFIFLSGKSHEHRSLVGYSPWGCKRVGNDIATKQQQWFNRHKRENIIFKEWAWQVKTIYIIINVNAEKKNKLLQLCWESSLSLQFVSTNTYKEADKRPKLLPIW